MRPEISTEDIYEKIREKQVVTIENLVRLSKCSISTMRRRLKKWQAYTSYNKNGKYYTLPCIPQFNRNGIWVYKKNICFSKYGSLKKTIIHFVNISEAGYSISELNELLHIYVQNFLSQQLKQYCNLGREKHNGVYIYYSKEPTQSAKQKVRRQEIKYELAKTKLLSDANIIIILVEFIKHPKNTITQLVKRLKRKAINVSTKEVQNLFTRHGILKKTLGD